MARTNSKISKNKRLELIQQELLTNGEISTEKLAKEFKVSNMTIHRDIEQLVSTAEAVRTYGGAAVAKRLTFEFAFQDKQQEKLKEKEGIAKEALKHIGLRPSKKMTLYNGALECKFQRYDMYAGSKKAKHQNK